MTNKLIQNNLHRKQVKCVLCTRPILQYCMWYWSMISPLRELTNVQDLDPQEREKPKPDTHESSVSYPDPH
jgi:hypothetical protein